MSANQRPSAIVDRHAASLIFIDVQRGESWETDAEQGSESDRESTSIILFLLNIDEVSLLIVLCLHKYT